MTQLVDWMFKLVGLNSNGASLPALVLARLLLWATVITIVDIGMRLLRRRVLQSRFEIDDLLLAVSQRPLRVTLLMAAMVNTLGSLKAPPDASLSAAWAIQPMALVVVRAGLVISAAWLLQNVLERAVIRVMGNAATRTDNRLDEMLVPIARTIIRPVLVVLAVLAILEVAGAPVKTLIWTGAALYGLLVFGAQSSLSDVFGGISLLLDAPFGRGDLLQLDSGDTMKVDHLGLRMTKLYDPVEHTDISIPNRILAGQKLVNLSRPTPDKRLTLVARVQAQSPDDLVRARLLEAALGHPWVLGRPAQKLPAMRRRIDRLMWRGEVREALQLVKELAKVRAEGLLDDAIQRHTAELFAMAGRFHRMEGGGFNQHESPQVAQDLDRLLEMAQQVELALTRWLLLIRYTYTQGTELTLAGGAAHEALLGQLATLRSTGKPLSEADMKAIRELTENLLEPALEQAITYDRLIEQGLADETPLVRAGRVDRAQLIFALEDQERWLTQHGFGAPLGGRATGGFTDLDAFEEYLGLFADWSDSMRALRNAVEAVRADFVSGRGRFMDEDLIALRRRLARELREAGPRWKEPAVALVDSDLGLQYELKVFVDNVKLSHFSRSSRTGKDLRLEVMHLLRDTAPPIHLGRPIMLLDPSRPIDDARSPVHIERNGV